MAADIDGITTHEQEKGRKGISHKNSNLHFIIE